MKKRKNYMKRKKKEENMKKNEENDEEEDVVRFPMVHTIKLKNTRDDNEEIQNKKRCC